MSTFEFNTYLRALWIAGILCVISLGILWSGGRLLRTTFGDVWWLRPGPKLIYFVMFLLGFPGVLMIRYGIEGLQVYVVTGVFAAVVLFFAGLLMRPG
jgi:hypothetical protein